MNLSFAQKILIAMLAIIFLVMTGVLFIFTFRTGAIAEEEVNRRLHRTGEAFANYLGAIGEKLGTINAYVSGNAEFKAYMVEAIDNGDQNSMMDQFDEIKRFSNCEFMIVLDAYGEPVVDTSEEIAANARETLLRYMEELDRRLGIAYEEETEDGPGLNEGGSPPEEDLVEMAEPSEEAYLIGSLASADRLFNVVMSPLSSLDFMHGYVVVGYAVDNSAAANIGKITNCDLIILTEQPDGNPAVVASYFQKPLNNQALLASLPPFTKGEIFDFTVDGRRFKGLAEALPSPTDSSAGRYVTLKSLREETAPFRDIRSGMLLIGLLAFAVVVPVSLFAARGVTRPVNQLVEAIEKVRDGEYDEKNIAVQSGDEIGVMAGAFKDMVRELREQKELIEFMEKSAAASATAIDPDKTEVLPDRMGASSASQFLTQTSHAVRKAMDDDDHLPTGFLLANRYEILNVIGQGGMGVVYRAKDGSLDEVVAIKMLHLEKPEYADMLKRETKLARMVTHRNILRIYDLGELGEIQFISMEFVEGQTLKGLLKCKMQLPVPIGLRVARQVLLGLTAAHDADVIHGDIKPENVIISHRGEVKVMDFGVARLANVETAGGSVSGTPRYMPPEQFQGRPINSRSDIYSLGIMLFELFAGEPPFNGKTLSELFTRHLNTPLPALRDFNNAVSPDLVYILERATQKRPEDRYESAREMLAALKQVV